MSLIVRLKVSPEESYKETIGQRLKMKVKVFGNSLDITRQLKRHKESKACGGGGGSYLTKGSSFIFSICNI